MFPNCSWVHSSKTLVYQKAFKTVLIFSSKIKLCKNISEMHKHLLKVPLFGQEFELKMAFFADMWSFSEGGTYLSSSLNWVISLDIFKTKCSIITKAKKQKDLTICIQISNRNSLKVAPLALYDMIRKKLVKTCFFSRAGYTGSF